MRGWATLGVLAALLLGCWSCDDERNDAMTTRNATGDSLASLGAEIGIDFPPEAKLLGSGRETGGMDGAVYLKVQIPAAAYDTILKQTPIDASSMRPGTRGLFGSDHGFWDPHAAKALHSGQAQLPGGRVLNVGVDLDQSGSAILYVMAHST